MADSSSATPAPNDSDVVVSERLCDNCDENPVALYCTNCTMELCETCDADFHRPAKFATHVRKARFPTAVADIFRKCEKEGKMSDYGASKPEGKNILKYVLEYEEGYYYAFRNNSKDLHLDAELEFNFTNLAIVGFEAATKIKISLPPDSGQYVHLQRVDPTLNCNCEITQRFALVPARAGKVSSVSVPVTYTSATPIDILKIQTEKEGSCTDHGSQDPAGLLIHQYQWEFSGGYCFLWVNSSKDILFHKELELDLKNLEIADKEPGTKKFTVDCKPGQREFMMLKEIEQKQAYGVSMRAGFSLQKIKATST